MKIVLGNKLKEMSSEDFKEILRKFENVEIDLGTGNGRYVYKKALKNPEILCIGIDLVEKQLRKYSKKALRKKLSNVLFVLGSAEMLPEELRNTANVITIILPWGSLLENIAGYNKPVIKAIKNLIKPGGSLLLVFGYDLLSEPVETKRLNLKDLDENYIKIELIPKYEDIGFKIDNFQKVTRKMLREIDTSWSKKLSLGKPRPIFYLKFKI